MAGSLLLDDRLDQLRDLLPRHIGRKVHWQRSQFEQNGPVTKDMQQIRHREFGRPSPVTRRDVERLRQVLQGAYRRQHAQRESVAYRLADLFGGNRHAQEATAIIGGRMPFARERPRRLVEMHPIRYLQPGSAETVLILLTGTLVGLDRKSTRLNSSH